MSQTVDTILDALGGTSVVASGLGINRSTVSSWRARGSIPADRWLDLVGLADARGVNGITLEVLAMLQKPPVEAAEARA